MAIASDRNSALAWTAFCGKRGVQLTPEAFNKGPLLLYAGQESESKRTPSLFENDKVPWGDCSLQAFLTTVVSIKKRTSGAFTILSGTRNASFYSSANPIITAIWDESCLLGLFNVNGTPGNVKVPLPDGEYEDLLTSTKIRVTKGELKAPANALVVAYRTVLSKTPAYSSLIDVKL